MKHHSPSPSQRDDAPEVELVASESVSCDGGEATGHPRVYLRIGQAGFVECPYCDKRFVLEPAGSG